jgi:RND family efflux transporter MFP subunit
MRVLGHITITLVLLAVAAGGCTDKPSAAQGATPSPQVTVTKPTKRLIAETDEYVGRFVAVDSVEVRARVAGYLATVHFRDGQFVKEGDLLFTIDRRPFEATLAQAQASLAQAKANLAFTTSDLERAQRLVGGAVITQQTFDQRTQAMRVAEANVAAQEAAVRQSQLDREFAELRAPVSGRIGDRRVTPGNLVTGGTNGNTTLLTTITSIDPIRFEFTFDEASYLRYVRANQRGAASFPGDMAAPVRLKLIDEEQFTREGKMDFVDNAIDRSSGTIRGRAVFANPNGTLTPGMFGRIQVAAGAPSEALLVPDVAIGTEQVRKFVFVVDANGIAQPKYVTLGQVVDGQRVISSGLDADDRVIISGLMRVRPGMKVTAQEAEPRAASNYGSETRPN